MFAENCCVNTTKRKIRLNKFCLAVDEYNIEDW